MGRRVPLAALAAVLLFWGRSVEATTFAFSTSISGGDEVEVQLSLTNAPGGDGVDVEVSIAPGTGDLLGLFFNLVDELVVPSMSVSDVSGIVTQSVFDVNRVGKVGGGNNVLPAPKKWDAGLRLGSAGAGADLIEFASFRLLGPGLTVAQLSGASNGGWVVGVRIQSTNTPEGSAKTGLLEDAPRLEISSPSDGALLNATPTEVAGTFSGQDPISVSVNGITANTGIGSFSASVALVEGLNTLEAVGSNALATTTETIQVTLDTTPPQVAITTPADGTLTTQALIQVVGTASDENGIASLTVNGQPVSLVNGVFSTQVGLVLGLNPISVQAFDAAGNAASTLVTVDRGDPPTVSIDVPAEGAFLNASPITVSGTLTGTDPITVLISGIEAMVSGSVFTAFIPLIEGPATLTADASNRFGSASASVSVTVDTTPPALSVASPSDGTQTSAATIETTGTATDASPITSLTVNGEPASLTAGAFSTLVSLAFGDNLITVIATDVAGNISSVSLTVTRGVCTPGETRPCYSGPPGTEGVGVCTGGSETCLPDGSGFGPCQGQVVPSTEVCNDGLDQDCDGSDCIILSIEIETPAADVVTTANSIEVTGSFGAGVVSVSVNGATASLVGGAFSATVSLDPGPNMIVVVASDASGNTGTDSLIVVRDNVAPTVAIDSPPDGSSTSAERIPVTGIVNDIVPGFMEASVEVNGVQAFVQNGTFLAPDVPLAPGLNSIVALAVDSVGNVGTDQIEVLREPPPVGAVLLRTSGDAQVGEIASELVDPLVVQVVDDSGIPLAGRVVRFEVSRGSGILATESAQIGRSVQVPTDGAGFARAFVTVGQRGGEGNHRIRATAVGVSGTIIFCATALPAPADRILAVSGENQKGAPRSPLAEPLRVLVVDREGNPAVGVAVTFSVDEGNGTFDGQSQETVATASDGSAEAVLTLGPSPGLNNNVASATFSGNPGLPATFLASALLPGPPSETRFAGVVVDNTNSPIPGTTVSIEATPIQTLTDDQGQFLLEGVPVGAVQLLIDPTTTSRLEIFPTLSFEALTVAGQINRLPTGPIRIPPLVSDAQVVGGASDVVLQMSGVPGLTLTVFAGSAQFPDGSTTGLVSINQVHLDKVPMPPPGGTPFTPPAWTIQPPGVEFDPPARVTIPNTVFPPGRVTDIFQFDHDLNRFVTVGPGTVTEDGLLIISDAGFGPTKSGWGGSFQPPAVPTDGENDPCEESAREMRDRANNTQGATRPFQEVQACIGERSCARAKAGGTFTEKGDELVKKVVPQFINRFLDNVDVPGTEWNQLVNSLSCTGPEIFPFDAFCAGKMANKHINDDLKDVLVMEGCFVRDDWEKIFDEIEVCVDETFPITGVVAKTQVRELRDLVREHCCKIRREMGKDGDCEDVP